MKNNKMWEKIAKAVDVSITAETPSQINWDQV